MFGMIGKFSAVPGKRDELISLLLGSIEDMPGCLSYVVARDPKDPDAVWISEVWRDKESHRASLGLPSVKAAIQKAMPIIARFDQSVEVEPVGGVGLPQPGK
jgi:quinol monooxygenase YgiN